MAESKFDVTLHYGHHWMHGRFGMEYVSEKTRQLTYDMVNWPLQEIVGELRLISHKGFLKI